MKREITYLKDLDIVLVKATDKYIFREEVQTLKKAFEVMQKNRCKRLFFDLREAESIVTSASAAVRARQYDEVGVCRTMKIGCVGRDEDYEDLKFFELVGSNRGWQTKLFTEYDDAIVWLTE